jgi:hypothetical protein
MNRLFHSLLLALLLAAAASAQPTTRPSARAVRAQRLPQKAAANRQLFVVPNVDHVFPYFLVSNAWTTTLHLTNLEDREIKVYCEFVNANGEELPLQFDFSANAEDVTAYTESIIPAFATAPFHTVSTATTSTTGWSYCSADPATDRFSGYAVVKNTTANGAIREFITSLQPDQEPVFSVPFTDAASGRTALVLVNNSLEQESKLAVFAIDADGNPAGNGTITLQPSNLRTVVLNEAFKDLPSGTIRVVHVEGSKSVGGMALRTNSSGYTAFLPLSPQEAPPAPPQP